MSANQDFAEGGSSNAGSYPVASASAADQSAPPRIPDRKDVFHLLRSPDFWNRVAESIGEHDYMYYLGDDSHRLDVVQIVCENASKVLARASGESGSEIE